MQEKNMGHICPIGRSGVNAHANVYQEQSVGKFIFWTFFKSKEQTLDHLGN